MKDNKCIFCSFDPKYIIVENEHAFATYFPRAIKRGHIVVAVKEHIPDFSTLNEVQAFSVIKLALSLSKTIKKILNAEKIYIVSIGDKDKHFHFHLLPKLKSDAPMGKHIMLDGGWKSEVGEIVSEQEVTGFISTLQDS